jgi:hypothetical protein
MAMRRAEQDVPEHGIVVGDQMWACMSYGVVYPEPVLPAVLAELLFPDDWSILPPG